MADDSAERLHATVDGFVQGVGFRMFVIESARSLRLTGWVRNTFDGKVEVVAEGDRKALEQLLSKLRQGPRSALVQNVSQDWEQATGEFSRFDVKRTV